jgi:hypothetical protein
MNKKVLTILLILISINAPAYADDNQMIVILYFMAFMIIFFIIMMAIILVLPNNKFIKIKCTSILIISYLLIFLISILNISHDNEIYRLFTAIIVLVLQLVINYKILTKNEEQS